MNYNRKTFRVLKIEKSRDFARRKNDVEDKMLDTKLKVMEKKERNVRQKLYEIRREKYSRTFYKDPERAKFVDVNVCETEEGENNKLNLITASGVERTKNCLRRKSIAVEELNPGQVVRVCVSSKLEDKVTRDETATPSTSLPPIVKAPPSQKRRHSLAIVTNIEQHNMADLFTSVASYMQSISEEREGANVCKDDLYFGRQTEEMHSETTVDERSDRNAGQTSDIDTSCSEKLRDLRLQSTLLEEVEEKNRNDCSSNKNKSHSCRQKALGEDDSSARVLKTEPVRKTETGCNSSTSVSFSPKKKVLSTRRENRDVPSNSRPRAQSTRSYSDSSLQERATFRKCSTPVHVLSKNRSRMRPVDTSAAVYESAALGHRHGRIRSLSAGSGQQDSVLTEKEAQMAEQVIIRQLEIKEGAERMKKLSLQHFGDSTLKIPRKQSCSTSPYTRRRLEDAASYETSNSTEGAQRPGIRRRHAHHNPQLLRKFVKDHCRNDRGQTVMKKVLCELSGDLPDCRYLRCGDKASESKEN